VNSGTGIGLLITSGILSPFLLLALICETHSLNTLDKTRPPMKPIVVKCLSPTGQKFHTDIGISFQEIGHMRYRIVEYNGKYTDFNGFCSASQVKNDP